MPVYFVRQGLTGNVKIGFTNDISKRVKQLQTAQPVKLRLMRLFEGGVPEERAMHQRFSVLSIGGEWFRFHPDMTGDVGLSPIEPPELGRYNQFGWPSTSYKYRNELNEEVLAIIGGPEHVARACGVEPWRIYEKFGAIHRDWWSAIILLVRDRGRNDITYAMIEGAHKAADLSERDHVVREEHRKAVEREAEWLRRNSGVVPWWPIHEKNTAILSPPKLELFESRADAA